MDYSLPKCVESEKEVEIDDLCLSNSNQSAPFTRSSAVPLEKDLCFFCQEDRIKKLVRVCTDNAGKHCTLHTAKPGFVLGLGPGQEIQI